MAPTSIGGDDVSAIAIDGDDVTEVTVDGDVVFQESAIPDSVVSRWQFNEGSGSTATDSEGTNDGTINGATYTNNSKEGSHALSFDGTDDRVTLGSPAIPETADFTFATWFQPRRSGVDESIYAQYVSTTGNGRMMIQYTADDEVRAFFGDDGSEPNEELFSGTLATGEFHHVAVVRDSTTFTLYVNGTEVDSFTDSGTRNILQSNQRFGEREGDRFFDGIIDDAMDADEAWTDQQVSDLYDSY